MTRLISIITLGLILAASHTSAMTIADESTNAVTFEMQRAKFGLTAQSIDIGLPECGVDYDALPVEQIQNVAFYVARDTLDYMTTDEIEVYLSTQLDYSNQGLQNSCIPLKQTSALIRYVDEISDAESLEVFRKNTIQEVGTESYIRRLAGSIYSYPDTALGAIINQITLDWQTYTIDRVVHVRPFYYIPEASSQICGVGYQTQDYPYNPAPSAGDRPENQWGEIQKAIFGTAIIVIPNDSICDMDSLLAHELGHTNGLVHERESHGVSWQNMEYMIGFGYHCGVEPTIMVSGVNTQITMPFFSSADITVNGKPCGNDDSYNGINSSESIKYSMGMSALNEVTLTVPYQGPVDENERSTWNTITSQRYDAAEYNADVSITDAPYSVTDSDGSFEVEVSRTNNATESTVWVKAVGLDGITSEYDLPSQAELKFNVGDLTKDVRFDLKTFDFPRQVGRIGVYISNASDMSTVIEDMTMIQYNVSNIGQTPNVRITSAHSTCDTSFSDCYVQVELRRTINTDVVTTVTIEARRATDSSDHVAQQVVFASGETQKVIRLDHEVNAIGESYVYLTAQHPSLIGTGTVRASFSAPTPGDGGDGSTDNGNGATGDRKKSGGSLGFFTILVLCVLTFRGKHYGRRAKY